MRVIVTGATGFLGGALTRALMARGDEVIALGRQPEALSALKAAGAHCVRGDLAMGPVDVDQADALIHTAGLSSPWGAYDDFYAANVVGTTSAISIARAARVQRLVHISTPSIYYQYKDQFNVSENLSLETPVNHYAATKLKAEAVVRAATDLDPIMVRPRALYGVGDTSILPRLISAARSGPLPLIHGGRAQTDLTYIDDGVRAVIAALDIKNVPATGVFNISGGVGVPIREVAETVAAKENIPIRWRKAPAWALMTMARAAEGISALRPSRPEPRVTAYAAGMFAFSQTLDISAAREQLGWSPQISFAEGIERTFGPSRD